VSNSNNPTHPRIIALRSACTGISKTIDEYQACYVEVQSGAAPSGSTARRELNERLTKCVLDIIATSHLLSCGLSKRLIEVHGPEEAIGLIGRAVHAAHAQCDGNEVETLLEGHQPWKM
jgi:hypothetical protein